MNIYEFMSNSPFLSFFLVWMLLGTIRFLINRSLRAMNIRKHGWPPQHCDADGDFTVREVIE